MYSITVIVLADRDLNVSSKASFDEKHQDTKKLPIERLTIFSVSVYHNLFDLPLAVNQYFLSYDFAQFWIPYCVQWKLEVEAFVHMESSDAVEWSF